MSMDLSPIKKLKLKEAFKDIEKFQNIISEKDYMEELFDATTRGLILIFDDESAGHTVFTSDSKGFGSDKLFRIINVKHKNIFLWRIDGVLFKKNSKCDCAFFTDEYIGFIEFKSNATNNTDIAIKENYEKACNQLKITITEVKERCKNVSVDLMNELSIEAFVIFNRTVPKNNAYQKRLQAEFQIDMGMPLHFKNETRL